MISGSDPGDRDEAVRAGAFDYLSKPSHRRIKRIVDRALTQARAWPSRRRNADRPRGSLSGDGADAEVYKQIAHAADSIAPVLIIGESGSGKELVARAIHTHSKRTREPFVGINCGAIADTLLESELFGHQRGSFTGAVSDHKGVFEQAGGGTVLLDEIGDTTAALQVRLFRVPKKARCGRGRNRPLRVTARVHRRHECAAREAVDAGGSGRTCFTAQRDRDQGAAAARTPRRHPAALGSFLEDACTPRRAAESARDRRARGSAAYTWPGNVRELRNTIERLVVSSRGSLIEAVDLADTVTAAPVVLRDQPFFDLPTLDDLERRYLLHVLDAVKGNRTRAAEVLGVDRRTLYRMAERFGIPLTE